MGGGKWLGFGKGKGKGVWAIYEMRAGYVGELNRKDGLGYCKCPLCGDVVFELDLERYEPETGEGRIECCTICRENFESDEEMEVDSDMIAATVFEQFRLWALKNQTHLCPSV